MAKTYYVYILCNKMHTVLYVGVTNNIARRIFEHEQGENEKAFTNRYNVHILVYAEPYSNISEAIVREKQIKSWSRAKKEQLINSVNPTWDNLFDK